MHLGGLTQSSIYFHKLCFIVKLHHLRYIYMFTIEYTSICSRKHFREQEAEKWWAENRARLYDKYDIHGEEDSITGSLSTSGDKKGATGQQYQSR